MPLSVCHCVCRVKINAHYAVGQYVISGIASMLKILLKRNCDDVASSLSLYSDMVQRLTPCS